MVGDIQCVVGEIFVYWQYEVEVVDVVFVVKGQFQGFVEGQVGIFYCVVVVDIQIVVDVNFYVEVVVGGDLVEYMVKKVDVGMDFVVVFVVQLYFYIYLGFFGDVFDVGIVVVVGQLFVDGWLVQGFMVIVQVGNFYVICQFEVGGLVVNYIVVGFIQYIFFQLWQYQLCFWFVVGVVVVWEVWINQYFFKVNVL